MLPACCGLLCACAGIGSCPSGFQIRGGRPAQGPSKSRFKGAFSVAGGYAVTGCAVGPYSLFGLAGIPTAHPVLVRSSRLVLACRCSFSCFSVRPATLANLSVGQVLGAVSVLQCSVPPAQAWRVPLLCIQRHQGVPTIFACACWWHCAAQLGGVVTAGDFAGYRLDTAREIPADVRPRGIGGRARCGPRCAADFRADCCADYSPL